MRKRKTKCENNWLGISLFCDVKPFVCQLTDEH